MMIITYCDICNIPLNEGREKQIQDCMIDEDILRTPAFCNASSDEKLDDWDGGDVYGDICNDCRKLLAEGIQGLIDQIRQAKGGEK